MSQKEGKFQSKTKKFGGGKPGGARGGKPGGKPAGRGFGKKFEGDRPPRSADSSARPPRGKSFDRPRRDDGEKRFGDKPAYKPRDSHGAGDEGGYKGKRSFGDRPPRRDGDEGGYKGKRSFGDRPPRRDGDEGGYKGKPSFGDRPPRRDGDEGGYKGKRSFGDRPPRRDGDEGGYKGKRSFGDRPPRRDGDEGGYKGKPSFGDRPPRRDGDEGGYKGKRSFGDRPPRRDGDAGGYKGKSSYGDRRPDSRGPRRFERDATPEPQYVEATAETRQKLKSDRPSLGAPSPLFLYGVHAVRAALLNPKREVRRLLVTESGFESVREAHAEALAEGISRPEPQFVEKADLERLLPRDAVHQDVVLDSPAPEETFLTDLLISADDNSIIVMLDQVTDPHNIGAILRSAAAFGAMAVIVQKLHAPELTGTLAKSASGAAEYVPLVREVNLSRALQQLKEEGFTCIGLAEEGKKTVAEAAPKTRTVIVLGAEGDGLRRLVAENCDVLAKLPTQGPISSLNVSNAAAIALYELVRAR